MRAELLQLVQETTQIGGAASRAAVASASAADQDIRAILQETATNVRLTEVEVPHDPVISLHETMPLAEVRT